MDWESVTVCFDEEAQLLANLFELRVGLGYFTYMKKQASKVQPVKKTIGTRIVEKYRPKMNQLTTTERKQLLEEGLAAIYGGRVARSHADRR